MPQAHKPLFLVHFWSAELQAASLRVIINKEESTVATIELLHPTIVQIAHVCILEIHFADRVKNQHVGFFACLNCSS